MPISFDPDWASFKTATPYRNIRTDHDSKFANFRDFLCGSDLNRDITSSPFVMQIVCHPNFMANAKEVVYYEWTGAAFSDELAGLPTGYRRANSFKNYKATHGHPKGLFYEINLYTPSGTSHHHRSRTSGTTFPRDTGHDGANGLTKGKHWLE